MTSASPIRAPVSPRADVVQMMNGVVDHVASERLDRVADAVASGAGSVPLVAGDPREPVGKPAGGDLENACNSRGILGLVPLPLGRGVLVPVRILRIVDGEHEHEPLVIDPEHVAHVTRILEGGPDVLGGAAVDVRSSQHGLPCDGVLPNQLTDLLPRERARVEPALVAAALDHPRPVLRIRHDWHRYLVSSRRCTRCNAVFVASATFGETFFVDDTSAPIDTRTRPNRYAVRRAVATASGRLPFSWSASTVNTE